MGAESRNDNMDDNIKLLLIHKTIVNVTQTDNEGFIIRLSNGIEILIPNTLILAF